MQESGQCHTGCFTPPGKEPFVHTELEAGWALGMLCPLLEKIKSIALNSDF